MGVRFTFWAVDAPGLPDQLTAGEISGVQENSLMLQRALRRVGDSSEALGVVQLLSAGHRRWWIGSLVESLRGSSPCLLNQLDVEHAEDLLSFVLRGWNCGATLRGWSPPAVRSSFPITPRHDEDLRLAVLSSSDFEFLRLFLSERLLDDNRRFVCPAGAVGIAPEGDDEWDAWVRQVIREIATTPLDDPTPMLVSLLG